MAQTIQFKRRVGSAGIPSTLAEGEPAVNDISSSGPANLYIGGQGGGSAVRTLISPTRQLERTGTQTVEAGAGNAKTFDESNFKLLGGAADYILQTDGAGNVEWHGLEDLSGTVSVSVSAPLAPTTHPAGVSSNPLTLTMANDTQIDGETDTVYPLSSAGVKRALDNRVGELSSLGTTEQGTIVDALNEVHSALTDGTTLEVKVTPSIGLTGVGTTASPLNLTYANATEARAGTDAVKLIAPAVLKAVSGDLETLATDEKTDLVTAINEIYEALTDGSVLEVKVTPDIGLTGVGTTDSPLNLTYADATEARAGTDAIKLITPATLKSVSGDLTELASGLENTDLVSAINSIRNVLNFSDPISGDGSSETPYTVTPASTSQINAGTDEVFPVTSSGLRTQIGAAVSTLTTNEKTLVPAVNELKTQIQVLQSALRFVGTYNVTTNAVVPVVGSPVSAGPLPTAAEGNLGYTVIATTAGTGTGAAPAVTIAVGDLIVSNGSAWILVPLGLTDMAGSNVMISEIEGMDSIDNVQGALEWLYANKIGSDGIDGVSLVGDGLPGGTPIAVGTIDGGTYA